MAAILYYHKITNSHNSSPLSTSLFEFQDHLELLLSNYSIIPIYEFINRLKSNTLVSNSIAITFDDGYKTVFTNAFPLLLKYNIPATIFLSS